MEMDSSHYHYVIFLNFFPHQGSIPSTLQRALVGWAAISSELQSSRTGTGHPPALSLPEYLPQLFLNCKDTELWNKAETG